MSSRFFCESVFLLFACVFKVMRGKRASCSNGRTFHSPCVLFVLCFFPCDIVAEGELWKGWVIVEGSVYCGRVRRVAD